MSPMSEITTVGKVYDGDEDAMWNEDPRVTEERLMFMPHIRLDFNVRTEQCRWRT